MTKRKNVIEQCENPLDKLNLKGCIEYRIHSLDFNIKTHLENKK